MNEDGVDVIALYDGVQTKVYDFCVDNGKTIYFIQENIPLGVSYLSKLNLDTFEQEVITEISECLIKFGKHIVDKFNIFNKIIVLMQYKNQ